MREDVFSCIILNTSLEVTLGKDVPIYRYPPALFHYFQPKKLFNTPKGKPKQQSMCILFIQTQVLPLLLLYHHPQTCRLEQYLQSIPAVAIPNNIS